MRNRWYERGKQWFTARYRRQTDRSNKAQVKTDNQEEQRFFSRITSKLKSDNPYALRRQFALRVVAFCLLLGVAYGLWQGAQHMVERDMLAGYNDVAPRGEASTVADLSARGDESWLANDVQLMVSSALHDVYEQRREHIETVSVQATVPDRLDLSQAVWPVIGTLDGGYGWYREQVSEEWRFRAGMMIIPEREQATVRASLPGTIEDIRTMEQGYEVVVVHPEGWATEYTGIDELYVELGDVVQAGERIGASYNSSRGEPVFFAVRNEAGPVDPTSILHFPVSVDSRVET